MRKIYLLSESKYQNAIYSPTIQTKFLEKNIDFSDIDTLIFTSKNGVKSLDRISKSWTDIPAISVGSKTSEEILKFNGNLLFTAEKFYGDILAQDIIQKYSDRKFLYIRPEVIASNIVLTLQNSDIQIQEAILYKTVCRDFGEIKENSIIIATSPSTLNCLFKNNIPKNSIFVAIGKTTFKAIPNIFKRYISKKQTIQSCIDFAENLR